MKRAALAAVVVALGLAPSAQATFPGGNGRIAYTWSVGGEAFEPGPIPRLVGVFSIRPDGSDRRLLARGGREPVYSPDGGRIAFQRSQRVWVARADGTGAHPVTPRGWLAGQQEWSPGGTRLVFVRAVDERVRTVLYSVAPSGRGLMRLVKAPMPISLYSGAWSPNGKAIVYGQSSFGRPLVRVFRGGQISTIARPGSSPTWSRRGLIAYETPRAGGNVSEVCLVRFETDAEVRCIGFDDASVTDPTWSPDGRRLMVMHTPQGGGPAEIWTVRPDGTVLTRAPRAAEFPIFSPNGRLLAYSRTRFRDELQYEDLFVKRQDGTGTRRLVRGGQAEHPDWQRLP